MCPFTWFAYFVVQKWSRFHVLCYARDCAAEPNRPARLAALQQIELNLSPFFFVKIEYCRAIWWAQNLSWLILDTSCAHDLSAHILLPVKSYSKSSAVTLKWKKNSGRFTSLARQSPPRRGHSRTHCLRCRWSDLGPSSPERAFPSLRYRNPASSGLVRRIAPVRVGLVGALRRCRRVRAAGGVGGGDVLEG
jgi:hypothetical protein